MPTEYIITPKVYVLFWKYSDGSACGVSRAYALKSIAENDLKLLEIAESSKFFELVEVDFFTGMEKVCPQN
jgi:hypothetical protein